MVLFVFPNHAIAYTLLVRLVGKRFAFQPCARLRVVATPLLIIQMQRCPLKYLERRASSQELPKRWTCSMNVSGVMSSGEHSTELHKQMYVFYWLYEIAGGGAPGECHRQRKMPRVATPRSGYVPVCHRRCFGRENSLCTVNIN